MQAGTDAAESYIGKKLMNIKKILQPLISGPFTKADTGSYYLAALSNTVSSISMYLYLPRAQQRTVNSISVNGFSSFFFFVLSVTHNQHVALTGTKHSWVNIVQKLASAYCQS